MQVFVATYEVVELVLELRQILHDLLPTLNELFAIEVLVELFGQQVNLVSSTLDKRYVSQLLDVLRELIMLILFIFNCQCKFFFYFFNLFH